MINKVELKKFSTTIISVLVLILLTSPTLFAQQQKVDGLVDRYVSEIIEIRHQIHQNPELGNSEFETAKLIAEHLRSLGIEVTTGVAHTGVVGILKGGKPGPVVAVRADMDALPVTEDTPLDFKSTVSTMYLCK